MSAEHLALSSKPNQISSSSHQMLSIKKFIGLIGLVMLVFGEPSTRLAQARNTYASYAEANSMAPTTTTTLAPTSSIEDPSNSATSESAEDDSADCFRCYDQVKVAQNMIAVQMDLLDKQTKLIRQKSEAAMASAQSASALSSTRKPKRSNQQPKNNTRVGRNRRLNNNTATNINENKPVVVSTLRVARSADWVETRNGVAPVNVPRNSPKNHRDPALKHLKHKQEQQLAETCNLLREVQTCLNSIARACLGDLQYHSQDVYAKQLFSKLNCAYNNSMKPFKELTRTLEKIGESEKIPVPRPISTQEAIQARLDTIFKGRNMSPLGVMLRPTLTNSASQRFNPTAAGLADPSAQKGNLPIYTSGMRQSESQQLITVSGLMLAPCFVVLMLVAVGMVGHYIKRSRSLSTESPR